MTREEFCDKICYSDYTNDCCSCDGNYNCDDCQAMIDPLLDKYEQTIRADERAKIVEEIQKYGEEHCWIPSHVDMLSDILEIVKIKEVE